MEKQEVYIVRIGKSFVYYEGTPRQPKNIRLVNDWKYTNCFCFTIQDVHDLQDNTTGIILQVCLQDVLL